MTEGGDTMKLWAKVRFRGCRNAECLVRAFFTEFNPQSSIVIRGKEAKLEIVFDETPIRIIEAISHCEVLELNYGKDLGEYIASEAIPNEEGSIVDGEVADLVSTKEDTKQPEQENAEVESDKQPDEEESEVTNQPDQEEGGNEGEGNEQPKKADEPKKNQRPMTEVCASKKEKANTVPITDILELKEIAEKAKSFEQFVSLVGQWLEMEQKQEAFKDFVMAATKLEVLSWKELDEVLLEDKGVIYGDWDKICLRKKVSQKLKGHSMKMLPFLRLMCQYKEYPFAQTLSENYEEGQSNPQSAGQTQQETGKEDTPKVRNKLENMPEVKEFEEILGSVDKTQPVKERVQYVLNAMGLNNRTLEEQRQIVSFVSAAVTKKEMAFDRITADAKIPEEKSLAVRMSLSEFINDFVKRYGGSERVKVLTFLSELQGIVMQESEIENC